MMKKMELDISIEDKIRVAARKIFQQKGYAATRTRDIAEQTGMKQTVASMVNILLITLFGIYAISTVATLRRRKEIAIRKVSGTEASDIIRMFFREYIVMVFIAGVAALLVAYPAMNLWLQGYAYHTNIPWWLFVSVIGTVIAVVLLTVLGQVLKVANNNPAEVVKSE